VSWGVGSPSSTMSPGPRPISVPSGILIHPAVWPQQTWAKNRGYAPFRGGELGLHLAQCGRAEAILHAKFHLDPSNRLASIHQHYRQTGQWSDNIGRTVLQMVAQKRLNRSRCCWVVGSDGPKESCIRWGFQIPHLT